MTTSPEGPARLTHVDESGAARMVDVSAKDVSVREAVATGRVLVSGTVVALLVVLVTAFLTELAHP